LLQLVLRFKSMCPLLPMWINRPVAPSTKDTVLHFYLSFCVSFNLQSELFKFQFRDSSFYFLGNIETCFTCLPTLGSRKDRISIGRQARRDLPGHPSNTRPVPSSLPNQCYIYSARRHDKTQVCDGKSI